VVFASFFLIGVDLWAQSIGDVRRGGTSIFQIYGKVFPAPGETKLPAVVWVTLRASGAHPYEEKRLLHRHGHFEFNRVPQGNYILSVKCKGYATSRVELPQRSAVRGHRRVSIALGSRLADQSLPLGQKATIDVETLRIPKKALREFQKASEESQKNKLDKALRHLQKAVELHPRFFQAFNNMGTIYLRMGRHSEAEAALSKAIEINSDSALIYKNMGFIYLLTHRWEQAIDMLSKATALDPSDVRAHAYLGEALYQAKRYSAAVLPLQRALRLDPSFYRAGYVLGYAYTRLEQYPEALRAFNDFLKTNHEMDASEVEKLLEELHQIIASRL
ncbi:tetratricopeptide repeat protein, partial [Acidobacteria bacterium AH-259-A15]|nr:tetratricopeptide repeat protein [Acidobacteria bacterium AH-259-A15]